MQILKKVFLLAFAVTSIAFLVSCNSPTVEQCSEIEFSVSEGVAKSVSTGTGHALVAFSELTAQKIQLECLDGSGFCNLAGATEGFVSWPTGSVKLGYGEWVVYAKGYAEDIPYFSNGEGLRFLVSARGISVDSGLSWTTSLQIFEQYSYIGDSFIQVSPALTVKEEGGTTVVIGEGSYAGYQLRWYRSKTTQPTSTVSCRSVSQIEAAGYEVWSNPTQPCAFLDDSYVLVALVSEDSEMIYGSTCLKLENLGQGYRYVIGSGADDYVQFGSYFASFETPTENQPYAVGDIGPTGGYIFYDCDADNKTGNADGLTSAETGWRYLEASPSDYHTDLVDPADAIRTENGVQMFPYGTRLKVVYGNSETVYVNGTSTYNSANCTVSGLGKGQYNTRLLVDNYGDSIYWWASSTTTPTAFYGAKLCDDYSVAVESVVYDDWFLPSIRELQEMYDNLKAKGIGDFSNNCYFSSSEYDYYDACGVDFSSSRSSINIAKTSRAVIRPVRAFYSNSCTKHDFVQSTQAILDCEVDGVERFTCSNCGWYYEIVTPATGHSFTSTWSHDSVNHWHAAICGHDMISEESAHAMDLGVVYREATSTTDGIKRYTCKTCGYYRDESFPKGTYVVGSKGPAGGIVFYVNPSTTDTWKYIEAAPESLEMEGVEFYYYLVNGQRTAVGGTYSSVGTGKTNTQTLVSKMTGNAYTYDSDYREYEKSDWFAAKLVDDLTSTYNGKTFSDWYLPSYGEMREMCVLYKMGVGGFALSDPYLTSTEDDAGHVAVVDIAWGTYGREKKYDCDGDGFFVRPVRYF